VSKIYERDRGATLSAGEMPLGAQSLGGAVLPAPESARREGELVASCRSGDPLAFAQLVRLHEGMVVTLAARLLGEAEEARDVAQEVFLQVYRMLGAFQGRSSLKTWIYRIAVNQCHNRRRFWRRRRRDRETALDEGLLGPALVPGQPGSGLGGSVRMGPYEETLRRERALRVQAALLGLRFEQRAVLVLREVEGLTCEEVAAALGVPEGTVKSRLSRAREAMRRKLRGLVEEGGTA
jgi:RNA polymerase sigma-70 factor (ECF subfamily)